MGSIMTVNGLLNIKKMGLTLPHEHIMVDFLPLIERDEIKRCNADEVVEVMAPYLLDIKKCGISTFIDCTPMYLGRDVNVLKEISRITDINIVTNTGMYKQPYLPEFALDMSPEKLAEIWIDEWENGIDGTDIRPGFIKTAVFADSLHIIQQNIIRAAAITSRQTGLCIATHCESAIAALDIVRILDKEHINPKKWIYVHVQAEDDNKRILDIAREGVWMELDAIGSKSVDRHLDLLTMLLDNGFNDRIMLSQDAGWYNIGQPKGGTQNPYTHIFELFIPKALEAGISKVQIDSIMTDNPASAFAID